jgi:hypothetical protein
VTKIPTENITVMYTAHSWKPEIVPVEVVKMTEHFATVRHKDWGGKFYERRQRHEGKFFATWEEAHATLVKRGEEEVRRSEEHLQRVRSHLGTIRALRKPESVNG